MRKLIGTLSVITIISFSNGLTGTVRAQCNSQSFNNSTSIEFVNRYVPTECSGNNFSLPTDYYQLATYQSGVNRYSKQATLLPKPPFSSHAAKRTLVSNQSNFVPMPLMTSSSSKSNENDIQTGATIAPAPTTEMHLITPNVQTSITPTVFELAIPSYFAPPSCANGNCPLR